jgi:methylmalonyl-CoA/ethylmalonyl-CoA epimerase
MRERGVAVSDPRPGRLEGPHGTSRGWRTATIDDAGLGVEPWRLPFIIQHDSIGRERLERVAAPGGLRPHPLGARRLDHVTVAVHDLAAALRLYARAFGLEPAAEGEDAMLHARTAHLPLPQGAIVLAAPLPGDGPIARGLRAQGEGLYSIAVAVDDLQAAVDALRGRGVGVRVEEPEGVLVAARPDPTSTHAARLELVPA